MKATPPRVAVQLEPIEVVAGHDRTDTVAHFVCPRGEQTEWIDRVAAAWNEPQHNAEGDGGTEHPEQLRARQREFTTRVGGVAL